MGRTMDKEVEKPKPHTIRKVRFLFLCVIFVVWLLIGGAVFQAIEGPVEDNEREELSKLRTNFLNNVSTCITGMSYYFITKTCLDVIQRLFFQQKNTVLLIFKYLCSKH